MPNPEFEGPIFSKKGEKTVGGRLKKKGETLKRGEV